MFVSRFWPANQSSAGEDAATAPASRLPCMGRCEADGGEEARGSQLQRGGGRGLLTDGLEDTP